jgi:hypothetical protein
MPPPAIGTAAETLPSAVMNPIGPAAHDGHEAAESVHAIVLAAEGQRSSSADKRHIRTRQRPQSVTNLACRWLSCRCRCGSTNEPRMVPS